MTDRPHDDPEIETVLRAYDAFARGDAAAAVADMDPEVEWIEPISFEMGGRRVGQAAVVEYLEASRAGWKHLTSEPTPHRVGPEIVIVHKLTGILLDGTPLEAEATDVFRFREGRIGRMRAYEGPEEAFAAAPLPSGREEIVAGWLDQADSPGDAEFRWWHLARDGDLWSIEARTSYVKLGREIANLWLIELDDEGRARGFAEWWRELPAPPA